MSKYRGLLDSLQIGIARRSYVNLPQKSALFESQEHLSEHIFQDILSP